MALPIIRISSQTPSSGSSVPQDDSDLVKKYFADIEKEFKEAQDLIDLIEKDQGEINKKSEQITQELQDEINEFKKEYGVNFDHDITEYPDVQSYINAFVDAMKGAPSLSGKNQQQREQYLFTWLTLKMHGVINMPSLEKMCNPCWQKIVEIKKSEDRLLEIDPGLIDFIHSFDSLRENSLKSGKEERKFIEEVLHPMFQNMRDKCEVDKLQAMMDSAKDRSDISDSDLERLAFASIRAGVTEQKNLQAFEDTLLAANDYYRTRENDAETKKAKHAWTHDGTDFFKHGKIGHNVRRHLDHVIADAKKMISLISGLEKDLSSEMASVSSPAMIQIGVILDLLIKKIDHILASDMSPKAKKEKILMAMMMAVGALTQLKAELAKEKSALEKMTADGAQKGATANIKDTAAQSEKMQALQKSAKHMKAFLAKFKVAMTVLSFLMCPGLLSVLAMGLITALDYTGTLDKATDALEKQLKKAGCPSAKLVAEIIVGYYEVGLLAGTSALDSGPAKAAFEVGEQATKEAIEIAVRDAVEQALEISLEEATEAVAQQMGQVIEEMTEQVQTAVKAVSQRMGRMTLRQTLPGFVANQAKQTFQNMAKEAFESIMNQAQEEISQIVRLADEAATKTADEMAVTALADAKNVSEASIKKMSDPSTAGTIIGRTAAQSMYVMGSQNLLLNIVLESMKASHVDKNSDTYKAIEMVTMVIQSLLMIVAGGSMMSGQVSEEGLPQLFSQITNAANTISLAVNGVGEGSLASVEEQQARVIPKLTQDQAAQQGFHFLLKRIFEEQRSEFDAYIQEASKTSQSNSRMASKLESMEVAADLQRVLQVTV